MNFINICFRIQTSLDLHKLIPRYKMPVVEFPHVSEHLGKFKYIQIDNDTPCIPPSPPYPSLFNTEEEGKEEMSKTRNESSSQSEVFRCGPAEVAYPSYREFLTVSLAANSMPPQHLHIPQGLCPSEHNKNIHRDLMYNYRDLMYNRLEQEYVRLRLFKISLQSGLSSI